MSQLVKIKDLKETKILYSILNTPSSRGFQILNDRKQSLRN